MKTRLSTLVLASAVLFLLGSFCRANAADIAHGQTLYQSNCQRCHGATPDVSRLRCASKVFVDTLGNHYGDALNISDADKTDLAAFIATQDAARYSLTGLVTNSSGGIAGVTVVAAGYSLPNVTNVTAANGSFTLSGVRPGDYTVAVSKSGMTFNPPSYLVGLATNASGYRLATSTNRTPISPVFISFTTNAQANIYLSPADGTTYPAPAVVVISVSAYDPDSPNGVAQLKLYTGTTLLQSATGDTANPLYSLSYNWSLGTTGTYSFFAVVVDYQGGGTTSAPVSITVTAPIPPPGTISLAAGKLIYDNNCSQCHGSPPGGNPAFSGMNPIPLFGASRYLIKPGIISTYSQHAVPTTNSLYARGVTSYSPGSVSNYVNNIMTGDEQSNLAAYIASQNKTPWSFSGYVKTSAGQGIVGATVTVSSAYNPGATAVTDANGRYSLDGLRLGDYTVSVSHTAYSSFYPPSRELWAPSMYPSSVYVDGVNGYSTVPSIDFMPVFAVSGSITNSNGRGFPGMTIRALQSTTVVATTVTDASGNYTLPLTNGSYTISPASITQYTFSPATRSVTVNANQTGISFGVTSYPPLIISGTIRGSTNQALAGVTVALNEAPGVNGVTDANGRYSLTSADPGTFTVTPVFNNYVFIPASLSATISTNSQTNVNFSGYLNSYSINGLIRAPNLQPIIGATVSIPGQSVLTSWQTGGFSLVATNGTYTISVSKPGFIITPATQTVTVTNGHLYGINFTAYLPITYVAPFGRSTNDGSSWASAKFFIQDGINATVQGGQVWVAANRYYERIGFGGISLYGGFAGNESALEQRNWIANQTSIDGNAIVLAQLGKSPGRIVSIDDSGSFQTRLDGFSVVNGQATSPSTGGGIYCYSSYATYPVIIANNTIYGNTASYEGAGIFLLGKASIMNNIISANQSAGRGGGLHADYGSAQTLIANNIISGNRAADYGAGIVIYSYNARVVNNTIVGNTLDNTNGAGGIYFGTGDSTNANNIVALNTGGLFKETIANVLSSNNCVFGNTRFAYSNLVASATDLAVDPQFVNSGGGDYHLLATSSVINAGSDSFVQGSIDIDGDPRIQGIHVDIGADEYFPPNVLPDVSITSPVSGSAYRAPATVSIGATATDSDGTITQVVFYAGSVAVGTGTSAPFSVTVSNLAVGTYSLTAIASDNRGGTKTSAAVAISVYPATAPTVSLTYPSNGMAFPGPATITLAASAQGNSGSVTQVLFYAGTNLLGSKTSQPYSITWSNAVEGNYYLTAVAKDNQGLIATSPSVNILVVNPPTFTKSGAAFDSGQMRLPITVEAGQRYVIQGSSNLVTWTSLVTNQSTGGPYEFTDTRATNFIRRFYRVLVLP